MVWLLLRWEEESTVLAGRLLDAGQQAPEAVEPVVRRLDHLAPRRVAVGVAWQRHGALGPRLGRDGRYQPARRRGLPALVVVVAPDRDQAQLRQDPGLIFAEKRIIHLGY